jgi:ApbE superfamily uncharacterized protein (UPF0280 family)
MTAARPIRETGPQAALLPDGRRLHLQHGPIDLVIEAWGTREEVVAAYWQAQHTFRDVLENLVGELAQLRQPAKQNGPVLHGPVARRMAQAVGPHASTYVTPMAAVAGAVADHVLETMIAGRSLDRAYVNNGGDIAIHLTGQHTFTAGIAGNTASTKPVATVALRAGHPVRGLATSGWRGRSLSLGIADAVTVLAETAATADVAATLIANAVDIPGSARVQRSPARDVQPDSDLGNKPVTVGVETLSRNEVIIALQNGAAAADAMLSSGMIQAAFMYLQGMAHVSAHPHCHLLTRSADYNLHRSDHAASCR